MIPSPNAVDQSEVILSDAAIVIGDPGPSIIDHSTGDLISDSSPVPTSPSANSIPPFHCFRCLHDWTPGKQHIGPNGKVRKPNQCPLCHSSYWRIPPASPVDMLLAMRRRTELRRKEHEKKRKQARKKMVERWRRLTQHVGPEAREIVLRMFPLADDPPLPVEEPPPPRAYPDIRMKVDLPPRPSPLLRKVGLPPPPSFEEDRQP